MKKIGLCYKTSNKQIILKETTLVVEVNGNIAQFALKMDYCALEEDDETIFRFPIDNGAVIHNFALFTKDIVINAKIYEKIEAINKYNKAREEGKTVSMVNLVDDNKDCFEISLGNLPLKEPISATIFYVMELETIHKERKHILHISKMVHSKFGVDGPETPNHTMNVDVKLHMNSDIEAIDFIGYPMDVRKKDGKTAELSLKIDAKYVDAFNLAITTKKLDKLKCIIEEHPTNGTFAIATFIPPNLLKYDFENAEGQIAFLVDTSGSMDGDRLRNAKNSIKLMIKSMSKKDRFNITTFNNNSTTLFKKFEAYNEESVKAAMTFIDNMKADGGTYIHDAINCIYSEIGKKKTRIILFTDGEAVDDKKTIELVTRKRRNAVIYSLGIGNMASKSIVKDLPKYTGGSYEFVVDGMDIDVPVMKLFKSAMKKRITGVELKWNASLEGITIPDNITFNYGKEATIYTYFSKEETTIIKKIIENESFSGNIISETADIDIDIQLDFTKITKDTAIHCIAGKMAIDEILCSDYNKVKISKELNILCDKTSFLAVSKDSILRYNDSARDDEEDEEEYVEKSCFSKYAKGIDLNMCGSLESRSGNYDYKSNRSDEVEDSYFDRSDNEVGNCNSDDLNGNWDDGCDAVLQGGSNEPVKKKRKIENPNDTFLWIVDFQKFDGSWDYCEDILRKIIIDNNKVEETTQFMTKIIILYLQKLAIEKAHFILEKAIDWCKNNNISLLDKESNILFK